jgi:hypothetical protein
MHINTMDYEPHITIKKKDLKKLEGIQNSADPRKVARSTNSLLVV